MNATGACVEPTLTPEAQVSGLRVEPSRRYGQRHLAVGSVLIPLPEPVR